MYFADIDEMVKELNRLADIHENDKLPTYETNWSLLCREAASKLKELEEYKYMYEDLCN